MKTFTQFLSESYFQVMRPMSNFKSQKKNFNDFSSSKEIIDHLKKINGLNNFETKISGNEITFHLNHSKNDNKSEWKNKNNIQLFPSLTITLKTFNNELRVVGFDLYDIGHPLLKKFEGNFFRTIEKNKNLFDVNIVKYQFDVDYTDNYLSGKFSGQNTKCYLTCYQFRSNEGLAIKTDVELNDVATMLSKIFHYKIKDAIRYTGQRIRPGDDEKYALIDL